MLRRFIVLTSLAAGTAIAVAVAVATPALAKGATQASITGPGLARPVTISAQGEALPGQSDTLSSLAGQTGLFTVLFGPGSDTPDEPSPLRTPPAAASLGPRYTLTYTVPGVTPGPGQPAGQVRQYLYPRAGRRPDDRHAARTAGLRPAAAGHRMAPRHPAADCHPDAARRPRRLLAPVQPRLNGLRLRAPRPGRRAKARRHDGPGRADRHDRVRRRDRGRWHRLVATPTLPIADSASVLSPGPWRG